MVQSHDSTPQKRAFGPPGMGEAAPGSINRQSPLEQEMGTSNYRDMIHSHNDKNKHALDRLPFQFPRKKMVRSHLDVLLLCPNCGAEKWGTEHTIGMVCSSCNTFVTLINPEAESRGYNPDLVVGFRGSATDKVRLKKEELEKKGQ